MTDQASTNDIQESFQANERASRDLKIVEDVLLKL